MSVLAALAGVLIQFQIAAGDPDALVKWSLQAKYARFTADWAAVKPHLRATRAVHGEYTAYGALCELLKGTGLTFRYGLPGETERDENYYIGDEKAGYILPYEDVCPTLTDITPDLIDTPRADWR